MIRAKRSNNITIYQKTFSDRGNEVVVISSNIKDNFVNLNNIVRPKCHECGMEMRLRILRPNNTEYKFQWVCPNKECNILLSSKLSLDQWLKSDRLVSDMDIGSKRNPIPGKVYHYIDSPCPVCNGKLYEYSKCCGAPEGLIECTGCDFNSKPSDFYNKTV